jgi:hypothetical protein
MHPDDPGVDPPNPGLVANSPGVGLLPPATGTEVGNLILVSGVQVGVRVGGDFLVKVGEGSNVFVRVGVSVGGSVAVDVPLTANVTVGEGVKVGGRVGRPSAMAVRCASEAVPIGTGRLAEDARHPAPNNAKFNPTHKVTIVRFIMSVSYTESLLDIQIVDVAACPS